MQEVKDIKRILESSAYKEAKINCKACKFEYVAFNLAVKDCCPSCNLNPEMDKRTNKIYQQVKGLS